MYIYIYVCMFMIYLYYLWSKFFFFFFFNFFPGDLPLRAQPGPLPAPPTHKPCGVSFEKN